MFTNRNMSRYVYSVSYFHFVPTIFAFLLVRQIGCLFVVYYIFQPSVLPSVLPVQKIVLL